MKKTLCLVLLLIVLLSGCLETKEAWAALVDDSVLKEKGWEQVGNVQKHSENAEIAGKTLKMNQALVNYRDERLAKDIFEQVQKMDNLNPNEKLGSLQFSSQFLTLRLVLPAGVTLPSEIVNKMISSQIENIGSQNNIKNFNETGSVKIIHVNGKEIEVKNYEGEIEFEGGTMIVKSLTSSWTDSDSTIIVIGIFPESIKITEKASVNINAEQEYNEIIKLIQNVK